MSQRSFSEGRAALDELTARFGTSLDRNEATTRLHLVDGLLFDVLNWNREECVAEESYGGAFTDYTLGRPARRLIVEAKREGLAFELPAGQRTGVVAIRTLLSHEPTGDAMRQALRYAQDRGVPYAAIANGHQVVAFLANRQDGVPPLEGRALVLASLEDMRASFRLLWDNLSRDAIGLHALQRTLRDSELLAPPPKLSERLPSYPRYRIRNRLQTDLQILAELFIEDLVHSDEPSQEEFLRECYSQSGALSQYALLSREILRTRYSALMQSELGVSAEDATPREGSERFKQDVLSAALSRRPIVLLGDVGVGKTIFIEHLMRVSAKDVFGDAIALYVDFVAEPAVVDDLPSFVARRIADHLLDSYGIDIEERSFVTAVYHGELARFDRGMFGQLKELDPEGYERERIRFLVDKVNDREGHLRQSLGHIAKGRRKQIVIFLDNIDQRSSEFQEQVYVIAHAMAESWPAAVFVSLRPSTFFASKRSGSLTAYQPRVFAISPPRVDVVLKKRIDFVLKRLGGDGSADLLPDNVDLHAESLTEYLSALRYSIEHNDSLVELIDNLSGGNVRRALEFVQTFIGSGNVDTEKMLDRIRRSGTFKIDVHQFLRAIMLVDYQDFVPEASPISNEFDLLSPDGREHFLVPLVVAEVERLGALGEEEGYVPAEAIYEFAQSIGYSPVQVVWGLERATETAMLEQRRGSGSVMLYRITSIGAYTVRRLPQMFAYIDAIISDTPIVDPAFREKIHDAMTIDERLSRAEFFRLYLDRQWNGLGASSPSFDWSEVSEAAREDIWRIGRMVAGWP